MLEWVVTSEESGLKLVTFLSQRLGSQYSARHLKRIIEQNGCRVNGRVERFASTYVGTGDHVALTLEQAPAKPLSHQVNPLDILFEDDELLVYNKPAGLTSDEKGILSFLKPYAPTARLIHRLDRETTGVLLLSKTSRTFDFFVEQFKQHLVNKRYRAIVDGYLEQAQGVIENYLGKKHVYEGQTIWGKVKPPKGLYAYTEWKCLKRGRQVSLVLCFPKTGRTHQIRVHLAEMGHPILGDYQYSKQFMCSYPATRYLLHAEEVSFLHPVTREKMTIQAPLPEDFLQAQKKLFT